VTQTQDDLAVDLQLHSIGTIMALRGHIASALAHLNCERTSEAVELLTEALAQTDYGKMKEWKPGEEPF
jgi:hypothetical protein